MDRRKFLRGTAAFTLLTVLTKIIGALYRIPLTNIIGAEGIGLYQMVFPLYTVLLTVTGGGVTTAMSKYIATLEAKNSSEASEKTLKVTLVFLVFLGAVAALFLAVFCRRIARIQGNPSVILPYLGIAPALLFVAIVSCFRGFFQGKQNLFPTAFSQLIEQIIKLAAGLGLSSLWIRHSVELAVTGATLGVSISELTVTIVLAIYYGLTRLKHRKKVRISLNKVVDIEAAADILKGERRGALPKKKEIFTNIYKTAIPSALGSLVLPLTQLMDSVLIVNVLTGMGMSDEEATVLFGIINGPINSLINLPVVVTLSLSIALLPKIASIGARGGNIDEPVMTALKFSLLIAIPCAAVFIFFPRPVLELLYTGGLTPTQLDLAAKLLRISSVTVLYVSLLQIATSILQAVGKAHIPAINLLIGAAIKIVFTLLLLLKFGIVGAVIASVLSYFATASLDFINLGKLKLRGNGIYPCVIAPLVAAFVMLGAIWLGLTVFAFLPSKADIILSFVVGMIFYLFSMFILKGVDKRELKSLLGT